MENVVRLAEHQARASIRPRGLTGPLACIEASVSSVTPGMPRSAAERTSGAQNSPGMRLRSAHLRTAQMPAPISRATASCEGQSASSDLGSVAMVPGNLGPFVLNCKANLSYDFGSPFGDPPGMADRMSESEEKAAFIGRTRAARMARFEKQKPMLTILGLDQGTYKQYETRTPLPWRLIPKFCAATGVDIEWLLTGEGEGPKTVALPEPRKRATRSTKQRAA
jgi:hypothetical protein